MMYRFIRFQKFYSCLFLFYFLVIRRPLAFPVFPYTTLFRSFQGVAVGEGEPGHLVLRRTVTVPGPYTLSSIVPKDRKSTRLNSSHMSSSYAVFCLKKESLVL